MNWRELPDESWLDYSVRKLCQRPYPGHRQGCPNFGKRDSCPPLTQRLESFMDIGDKLWLIWNRFDLGIHATKMRVRHPEWSVRQVYCCLYWQGTARKELRLNIDAFLLEHPGLIVLTCPEAHGVNVTEAMRCIGIGLEWPPIKYAYQVALAGKAYAARCGD